VTLLHLFDGARLLSLECAVLWVPALLVGVAIGFAWGFKWKTCHAGTDPNTVNRSAEQWP
jgi:hypothetical protein